MATGAVFKKDDRVNCTMCSEPFRGRHPKLLPCYHTVCLPCLQQLAQSGSPTQVTGHSTATVTCPTCGSTHPVPADGVRSFQTDMYVGNEDSPDISKEQDTTKSHDQQGGDLDEDLQIKDQITVLKAVMARLRQDEEEINQQRQGVEQQILTRFETGVGLLEECRDTCLLSLRATTQQVKDKVQAEMDSTLLFLSSLQALTDDTAASPRTSASKSKPRAPLLSDAALRHFRHLSDRAEKPAVFSYTWSHNTAAVMDSVREFMGSVSAAGVSPESGRSCAESKETSSAIHTQPLNTDVNSHHATELLALQNDLTQLRQDLASTNDQLKHLTSVNDQLKQDLTSANDHLKKYLTSANDQLKQDLTSANDQLKQDLTSANDQLKQDLTSVNDQLKQDLTSANDHLKKDLTSANDQLKQDLTSANDQLKHLTSVTAELGGVKKGVADCEKDVANLQQTQQHTDRLMTQLKAQIGKLNTPVFFNTHLSKHTVFSEGATLVMDRVLDNTGGGYDLTTGVFTAPLTATYLFMATTRTDSELVCLKETRICAGFDIMVEGKPVASSWCRGPTSCTAHAVVRLDAGHKVWLRAGHSGFSFNCDARGNGFTSFCGLLTRPEL